MRSLATASLDPHVGAVEVHMDLSSVSYPVKDSLLDSALEIGKPNQEFREHRGASTIHVQRPFKTTCIHGMKSIFFCNSNRRKHA